MTIVKYLNLNPHDLSNLDIIFTYVDNYLKEIQSKDFPKNQLAIIDTVIEKFIDCGRDLLLESHKYKTIKTRYSILKEGATKPKSTFQLFKTNLFNKNSSYLNEVFVALYSDIILVYKILINNKSKIEFNDFYKPQSSNKNRISFLINKAIELIKIDEHITEKAKNKLIDQLNKILGELNSENSNWTLLLGKIKETIFILGALGAMTTAAINTLNYTNDSETLLKAKNQLEEIEKEMEDSISFNQDTFQRTFKFSNKIRLKHPSVKEIQMLLISNDKNKKNSEDKLNIEDAIIEEEDSEKIVRNDDK